MDVRGMPPAPPGKSTGALVGPGPGEVEQRLVSGGGKSTGALEGNGLVGPGEVEQRLVSGGGGFGASPFGRAAGSWSGGDAKAGGGGDGADDGAVALLSRHGTTVAMQDLSGQTAPEPDWYRRERFVCSECLQPCEGIRIGWPIAARKCPKTGITQWIVRGRMASLGCAMRYATDRRHSFWQETSTLFGLMLTRVYGMTKILDADTQIPVGEQRSQLPPFQPELCAKWGRGELQWSAKMYHEQMWMPTQLPDPTKHQIVSDHSALLIDTLVSRFKLGITAKQLREMFPDAITKSKPSTTHADTENTPTPTIKLRPATVDTCIPTATISKA